MSVKRKIFKPQIAKNDNGMHQNLNAKMTVIELYKMQIAQKCNVRPNTIQMREYLMDRLKGDPIGNMDIGSVGVTDVKNWIQRCKDGGLSYTSIKNHKRSLSAAFQMAVVSDYIRKNPFNFDIRDVIENDTLPKAPLSAKQQKRFLDFVKNDKVYSRNYDELVVFLGTGLRASELCGLTLGDIDFSKRTISVNHQLLKNSKNGYYIAPPKTKSSYRKIYMTDKVYMAMKNLCDRAKERKSPAIDGLKGFIFLNKSSEPMTVSAYDAMFRRIVKKYKKNNIYPLPESLTPHTLRHTFCTNMANAGMNPKSLQYIMGHSAIAMTMNYYTHASFENAKKEMKRITA